MRREWTVCRWEMHDDVGGGTERREYELMADEREEGVDCLPVGCMMALAALQSSATSCQQLTSVTEGEGR